MCKYQHKHIPGIMQPPQDYQGSILSLMNGSTSLENHPLRNKDGQGKNPLRNANLIDQTLSIQKMNHIKNNDSLAEIFSLFSIREVYPGHASHLLHHARYLIGFYSPLMEWLIHGREVVWPLISWYINIQDSPKLACADCVFNILSTHCMNMLR